MDPLSFNLRHLHAFAVAAELSSISRAAEVENLSQPALTQGVAKIERELGVALLDRRPDGVSATPAGKALMPRILAAFAWLAQGARANRRGGGRGFARPERLITATQLRAFLALADHGSFVAAATDRAQSQPALHRAVRDLESLCGVALVERRGRGVVLTDAGRRLARGGRLAVGELTAGLAEAAPERGVDRVTIGAMPLCRALVLPHAVAAFARGERGMLDVREGSWRELVEPLADGTIDLMIGALRPVAPPGLAQTPLFDDRLVVVARAGHPLAGMPKPGLADLARYGWIVAPPGSPLRARWEALFAGAPTPATPIECGSVMVIRGVLRASELLTLLSPDQVALELASGILATIGPPLEHGVRTIGVTTRAGWRPSPAQQRFLDLLAAAVGATRLPESR